MLVNVVDPYATIGRPGSLFEKDLCDLRSKVEAEVGHSRCLVIGAAGSIGSGVVYELLKSSPKALDLVDINENGLADLVRHIRGSSLSSFCEIQTFCISAGSTEFEKMIADRAPYDFVFNLSALKHVRSEKDPYTLMNMFRVNIVLTRRCAELSYKYGAKKYFCVSTDKATNPVNVMGATKRLMEKALIDPSRQIEISSARFANILFSNGSITKSFEDRLVSNQPLVIPIDVKRYFMTQEEAGQLCVLSCICGKNGDIFFPLLDSQKHLISFELILERYLEQIGKQPIFFSDESSAKEAMGETDLGLFWPCLASVSDTNGEKKFEEFFDEHSNIDTRTLRNIGIVKDGFSDNFDYCQFENDLAKIEKSSSWTREIFIDLAKKYEPTFMHSETGFFLDQKM